MDSLIRKNHHVFGVTNRRENVAMKFAQVNGNKNQLEPINVSISSGKGGREIHSRNEKSQVGSTQIRQSHPKKSDRSLLCQKQGTTSNGQGLLEYLERWKGRGGCLGQGFEAAEKKLTCEPWKKRAPNGCLGEYCRGWNTYPIMWG